jgi:hypothetical protein
MLHPVLRFQGTNLPILVGLLYLFASLQSIRSIRNASKDVDMRHIAELVPPYHFRNITRQVSKCANLSFANREVLVNEPTGIL